MLLYLLMIYAPEYLIISDRNKTPLNSTQKFETARHRLLFETLIDYKIAYRLKHNCLDITEDLLKYIRVQKDSRKVTPSIYEIKLLFATDIINKFKIGKLHIGMLDFAKDFDNNLWKYLNIMMHFGFDNIKAATKKFITQYTEIDYWINKSYSYVCMLYMRMFYEMVCSQIDSGRWIRKKGCAFDRRLLAVTKIDERMLDFIFKQEGCHYTESHFDINDIFTIELTETKAIAWSRREHTQPVYVFAVYSCIEIMNAFKRYSAVNHDYYPNTPKAVKNMIRRTITQNHNFQYIRLIVKLLRLYSGNKFNFIDIKIFHQPNYYFFFNIYGHVDEKFDFKEWEKQAMFFDIETGLASAFLCEYPIFKK